MFRVGSWLITAMVVALATPGAACGESRPATRPPEYPRYAAILRGTIEVEGQCVRVDGLLLVWRSDFTVSIKGGVATVVDNPTGTRATLRTGDQVTLGGGRFRYDARDLRYRPPDRPCRPTDPADIWIVGGIGPFPTSTANVPGD